MTSRAELLAAIGDVIPADAFESLMDDFDIGDEHFEDLASAFHVAKLRLDDAPTAAAVQDRTARLDVLAAALAEVRRPPGYVFVPSGEGMLALVHHPRVERPGALPQATLEQMLEAVIVRHRTSLAWAEAEMAEIKAYRNKPNLNRERFFFWLSLMAFWHFRLGRPLGTSTSTATRKAPAKAGGPLVRFVMDASIRCVPEEHRTASAVRNFVNTHRALAVSNPHHLASHMVV